MKGFLAMLVDLRVSGISRFVPQFVRQFLYRILPVSEMETGTWRRMRLKKLEKVKAAPLLTIDAVGIIENLECSHVHYEAACLELGVPYKLVNISSTDWIQRVEKSGCGKFLVWPSSASAALKRMFDDRLKVMTESMGRTLLPSYESLWLYESKRRMHNWMSANSVPHPLTRVFYNREEALDFAKSAVFPIVFKTDIGASATGVEIVRDRKRACRLVDICFSRGYLRSRSAFKDRQCGFVIFQEYVPGAREWRVIRVGESFFGNEKLRKGDYHSGTKLVGWGQPPRDLMDLCRGITEKGNFRSMAIDVFQTVEGEYLVNELQTVFGQAQPHQMIIDGKPGRYIIDRDGLWKFEEGDFCRNNCCNLRVKDAIG